MKTNRNVSLFSCPTEIIQKQGISTEIGSILKKKYAVRNILIITDKGMIESGHIETIKNALEKEKIKFQLFDSVEPEPSSKVVENNMEIFNQDYSAIVAVGGGSVIDSAKGFRVLSKFGGSLRDYAGFDKTPSGLEKPLIAIPTTAGTGSETSFGAVFTDDRKKTKFVIYGINIAPNLCIADPMLTISMPPQLTAHSGTDAMVHLIESYVSRGANPISDGINLKGLEMVSQNIEEAVRNGENIHARTQMQWASLMAGIGFNYTMLGLCHAMQMPLCAQFKVIHGKAVGTLLPHAIQLNFSAEQEKYTIIAQCLGIKTESLSSIEIRDELTGHIKSLLRRIGIPIRLRDYGVKRENFDSLIDGTFASAQLPSNPREVNSELLLNFLENAL